MLRIGGYIELQQANRLILLAEQGADKGLHGHQVVVGIELRRAPGALNHLVGAVLEASACDGSGHDHLLPKVDDLAPLCRH